jgi:LPS export ABC transporter protein LptC
MRWQKRARLGIAIFGIAAAGVVFFAIGERQPPVAAPAPDRLDPSAMVEAARGFMNRVTGTRQDFVVKFDHQLSYENGQSKLLGVRIEVKERQGRDFVITGAEALANEKTHEINLTGSVKLTASDGFELSTPAASFRESDGVVRTPGAVTFKKGGMSGTGVGMTYDKNTDVLTIIDQAQVRMVDQAGASTGEFSAGAATLDRVQNYLALERAVHVVRGEQTIDAERAKANLTENEEALTSIELRGSARVAGGSAGFDSMSARDIDLDYADDGETIEKVSLTGAGAIALKGPGGAGRQMTGESLTIALAADGSLTSAIGRDGVRLDLPGVEGQAARQVSAKNLDAAGEPGKGMTSVRFRDDVEYAEQAAAGASPRTATSSTLELELDGDAIRSALFRDRVRFSEKGLEASAHEARYDPSKGTLHLEDGSPRVADERIAIEAETVDVTLEGRKMLAGGNVKTILQGQEDTPGLLEKKQPTNVSAANLEYEGESGLAIYKGSAQLWQGDTAIRGDTITIDRQKGNLSAVGSARSTLTFGDAASIGRAEEIRYEDATRQIAYVGIKAPIATVSTTAPAAPAAPSAPAAPGAPAAPSAPLAPLGIPAQLGGPQGDLKADRIVVILSKQESKMERLEAYGAVTLRLDQRLATGTRLTYFADEERYVMSGTGAVRVTVVEGCRETSGRTLTFFKSTDRIIVDGNEEIRTRTTGGGPCPQPPAQ